MEGETFIDNLKYSHINRPLNNEKVRHSQE